MAYNVETVEFVTAECDGDGCENSIESEKLSKAYERGWLFYTSSRGDRKVKKAFCPEHRALIISSIDEFLRGDSDD